MPHLPHSKPTYCGHKNVKRTTFATLAPFGQKEMEHARGSSQFHIYRIDLQKLDATIKRATSPVTAVHAAAYY